MSGPAVELLVERPVAGGDMLARHDGRIVFLRGVIPGERVRARMVRQAKGVGWAELVEVVEPSVDRRPVAADPTCGGLHFAHIEPGRQRALKAEIIADAFRRIGKRPLTALPTVHPSPEHGYRIRARLHVRQGAVGFFRDNTHSLCEAGPSGQLAAGSLDAVRALVARLGPAAAHCEAVLLSEDLSGRSRVLHLEPTEGAPAEVFRDQTGTVDGVTGLTTSSGDHLVTLAGVAVVTDTAVDLLGPTPPIPSRTSWTRHPTSFFQGNRFLVGALLAHVLEMAVGERLADLYAGVGLFAVALAARGAQVVAVEGDASGAEDLRRNAEQVAGHLSVIGASVERAMGGPPLERLDSVVLDPPRVGLSAEALSGLIAWHPRRVVYVSCDPPTLARDAAFLIGAGYELQQIEAFDLFPNTPHVETVAVFDAVPRRG